VADEFDFRTTSLACDLRDGVRLARLADTLHEVRSFIIWLCPKFGVGWTTSTCRQHQLCSSEADLIILAAQV
jgi:hypothetical protein